MSILRKLMAEMSGKAYDENENPVSAEEWKEYLNSNELPHIVVNKKGEKLDAKQPE